MNTIIINLNDTIAMSDSAIVGLAKVINTCQPCVLDADTSCNDVKIVAVICATIIIVALIAKWAIWSWQKNVISSKKQERYDKATAEKEESERKQKADETNHNWKVSDEERKRKNAIEDEERKRKYELDDEERKRKNAIEDEERKQKYMKELEKVK